MTMHRWLPLNDRQLVLLTRIGEGTEPVTSDSPELAATAHALKGRGLIIMPKQGGRWQADITNDGRFYLEHGHHPDRPERTPRRPRSAAPKLTPQAGPPSRPQVSGQFSAERICDQCWLTPSALVRDTATDFDLTIMH
ncbi:hypothetical protein [Streptomyces sp. NPDC088719]|uniref:hypothetical protein n=1 Tax=Streptomyces sp. NPDC088719 TaxID=3365872 RepID=UPI003802E926